MHLEFFSSIADIARAKYEIVETLPSNGTAVLNADDEYVSQFGRNFKGKVSHFRDQARGGCFRAEHTSRWAWKVPRSIWWWEVYVSM